MATLRRMSFTAPSDPTKHPPEVRIGRLRNRIREATDNIHESREKLKSYADKLDDLYFLSDYMIMRQDKYDMLGRLLFSGKTFILDGFVAEEDCAHVEEVLTSKFELVFESRDPLPDEEIPAKFKFRLWKISWNPTAHRPREISTRIRSWRSSTISSSV